MDQLARSREVLGDLDREAHVTRPDQDLDQLSQRFGLAMDDEGSMHGEGLL